MRECRLLLPTARKQEDLYNMEQYKEQFIEFMIDCNVLKFGDFVTKSGRKTPFL